MFDYFYHMERAKYRIEREGEIFREEYFDLENELDCTISATILMERNGEFIASVIGYGGYKERILPILKEHYNTEEKVIELINKGIIQKLEPKIEDCKTYPDVSYTTYEFIDQVFSVFEDCYYMFKEGKWFFATRETKTFEVI